MALTARVVRGFDAWDAELPAWDGLAARCRRPNPFYSREALQAWRRFPGNERDTLLVLVEDQEAVNDERLVAALPLFEVWGLGATGLWPALADVGDDFTPLAVDEAAANALFEACAELLDDYAFVWLPLVKDDWAEAFLKPWLAETKPLHRLLARTVNLTMAVPEDRDLDHHLDNGVRKKTRQTWRRSWRKLEAEGFRLECLTTPEAVSEVLFEIAAVEAASWKGQEGVGVFSKPSHRRFYFNWLPAMAEAGRLRLHLLRDDNQIAAYQMDLLGGDAVGVHNIAFLPEWGHLSPGHHVTLESLRVAFAADAGLIDFQQGDGPYKRRFASTQAPLWDLTLYPRNLAGYGHRLAMQVLGSRKNKRRAVPEEI